MDATIYTAIAAVVLIPVAGLFAALDAALFLAGPTFDAYLSGPERRPSCLGCYPDDPAAIRGQLDGLFTAPGGPGLPGPVRADLYLGRGEAAGEEAGAVRHPLRMWRLIPLD